MLLLVLIVYLNGYIYAEQIFIYRKHFDKPTKARGAKEG